MIDLLFQAQTGGPPLVRVQIDGNGCGSVSFRRGDRQEPVLGEAYKAIEQLHHILDRPL